VVNGQFKIETLKRKLDFAKQLVRKHNDYKVVTVADLIFLLLWPAKL